MYEPSLLLYELVLGPLVSYRRRYSRSEKLKNVLLFLSLIRTFARWNHIYLFRF